MKTKMFKLILPIFAMLLAVGFAFASEGINQTQSGYVDTPFGPKHIQTDCVDDGTVQCMLGDYFVFKDIGLSDPLYERTK